MTGKERHLWEGHDENHINKKHPGKICIKGTLLKMSVVLHKFLNGEAKAGGQKFPFAFQLPNELPSSFFYVGAKESELRVTYRLTATMGSEMTPTKDSKIIYKPLVNKRLLIISNPPSKINFNVLVSKDYQATSLGFIKNGSAEISCTLERDSFQPSETINFRLSIDNMKCSQSVNGFKCKLYREIRAWTQTRVEFIDRVELIKMKFTDVVPA